MKTTIESAKNTIIKNNNGNLENILSLSDLHIGMILDDKYEIKREIARGGMGIVYEAYDTFVHRQVAIKIMLGNKIDSLQLKRFGKEIEACARLSHPNVIKIYDAGTYEKNPYIIMEYIDGVNICKYVAQHDKAYGQANDKEKRDWKLCARLIYETALGLDYIHKQKIFHRDIKPSNIIVRSNGSPVIIDFGLIKFNQENSYNLTRSRDIIGTCQYMSIEQAQGKRATIDERSDVYSLGLVLYELLTKQQAYTGRNMSDIFNKIVSYYPPLPREINPHIPTVLEKITMHAIEKDKNDRYSNAKEFADALEEHLYHNFSSISKDYKKQQKREFLEKKIQKTNQKKATRKKILKIGFTILKNLIFIIAIVILCKNVFTDSNKLTTQSQVHVNVQQEKILQSKQAQKEDKNNKKIEQKKEDKLHNSSNQQKKEKKIRQNLESNKKPHKTAKQEEAEKQYNLAKNYENGIGVEKNLRKSCFYYEKAANQGHIEAQYKLGSAYIYGSGVKIDLQKAFYWFEKAANQRHAISQYMLGFFYARGSCIEKDLEKARYWYEQAAKQGHRKAREELRRLDNQ